MNQQSQLYDLAPSPGNMKVPSALLPPALSFIDHDRLSEGHPRIADWVRRVVALDRQAE